uniref:Elongation factor Ts, mitochondrial n=1 Tax=Aceria tosichella TaxID=561515 RepID=A0A6G1SKL4_9ACAR
MLNLTGLLMTTRMFGQRLMHSSAIRLSAEKSPLFKLRQRTGLAYNLCREALNKHDNDVDEAEAWLKAHALAHGIQRASKVRDRSTREGLVCLSVSRENNMTTFVELNCESDFVARNQIFRDFAISITEQVAIGFKNSTSYKLPSGQGLIGGLKPNEEQINKLQDQIAPLISKLGENIKLSNAFHLKVTDPDDATRLFGQIHAQAAAKSTDLNEISAGRFGSIVALRLGEKASRDRKQLQLMGNRLCQHVIGYSPSYIELPDNIRKHLEAAEKEKLENKSDNGEHDDTYSDDESSQSSRNSRDDWPSIMDQTLIMTDDLVVRDFCKNNNLSIVYFSRFECGME